MTARRDILFKDPISEGENYFATAGAAIDQSWQTVAGHPACWGAADRRRHSLYQQN